MFFEDSHWRYTYTYGDMFDCNMLINALFVFNDNDEAMRRLERLE